MEDYVKKFELNNEEKYECPICLIPFENTTKVIGLRCSNMHIYHSKCLEELLLAKQIQTEFDHVLNHVPPIKCAVCRTKLEISETGEQHLLEKIEKKMEKIIIEFVGKLN